MSNFLLKQKQLEVVALMQKKTERSIREVQSMAIKKHVIKFDSREEIRTFLNMTKEEFAAALAAIENVDSLPLDELAVFVDRYVGQRPGTPGSPTA